MFRRIHLQCHVEIGTTAPLIPVCFPVFCVQAYFQQIIEKVKICIDAPRIVFTVVTNCDTFLILCHNSSIYFSCMAAAREVDHMALGECSFIQKFTVPVGGCPYICSYSEPNESITIKDLRSPGNLLGREFARI